MLTYDITAPPPHTPTCTITTTCRPHPRPVCHQQQPATTSYYLTPPATPKNAQMAQTTRFRRVVWASGFLFLFHFTFMFLIAQNSPNDAF
jgi:hypothetical protein